LLLLVYDVTERASIKPSYTEAIGTHWTHETHCGSLQFTIMHRDTLSLNRHIAQLCQFYVRRLPKSLGHQLEIDEITRHRDVVESLTPRSR